jgi:hypothetical protein
MPQSSQCLECLHYFGEFKCEAFPKGIPEQIYIGQFDHIKEFEGDNGIRFESLKKFIENEQIKEEA